MEIAERHLNRPQWVTTSRLLQVGEAIEFHFFVPEGTGAGVVDVFERYLERAEPSEAFAADGDLSWLDGVEAYVLPLNFAENRTSVTYRPKVPGNYLARWRAGGEVLYRYFAVIEDDWVVVRFSTGGELNPRSTLHAMGIPLDYRLPVVRVEKARMSYPGTSGRFEADYPIFRELLTYHRRHGDAVIPHLPDTSEMDVDRRVEYYAGLLEAVRDLMPDPNAVRSARVSMRHALDTRYTETFARLGVNDHCGLEEANTPSWLGMPEFPYFASPLDCRKVNQGWGGSVVAHQWDFCGGWHFLGPAIWHHQMSAGRWDRTETCIRQGIEEARNMSDLSGHPAFLFPLYDGAFERGETEFEWVERMQRLLAFRLMKEYPLAFARLLDVADYYRRHFSVTPATVFVSATDHVNDSFDTLVEFVSETANDFSDAQKTVAISVHQGTGSLILGITFDSGNCPPSDYYVDRGGTFRSPGEGFEDGAGIFRSVGDDYIDYSGVLRSPGEDVIDNSGTLRSPGEGFIDGNGIYRGG